MRQLVTPVMLSYEDLRALLGKPSKEWPQSLVDNLKYGLGVLEGTEGGITIISEEDGG